MFLNQQPSRPFMKLLEDNKMTRKLIMPLAFVFGLVLFTCFCTVAFAQQVYTGNATHLRDNNNQTYTFNIIGASDGGVWGSDVYTDDSDIARAAVHAGIVAVGESKTVTIRILPGRDSYDGTTRNGVTSSSYDSWHGSYSFER